MITYVSPGTSDPIFEACASGKATRSELVAVFVAYVEQHPQRRHDEFIKVALDAFKEAYPCKK